MRRSAEVLRQLRERGFVAELRGDRLRVAHPERQPRDEARTLETLRAHRDELVTLLEYEQHPAVRAVADVFAGARLVAVRGPGLRPTPPDQNAADGSNSAAANRVTSPLDAAGRSRP